jgi:large subunit ribosomal protein L5
MTTARKEKSEPREKEVRNFLEKIVVNAGVGKLSSQQNFEKALLPEIVRDVGLLAGQRPQARRLRKSVAGFKAREGQIVGVRVTLRGSRMVDFFTRLIRIVMPRVRDFRGVELRAVDEGGTLHLGFREQLVFPEVNPEESRTVFSLGVNIVPRKRHREKAIEEYRKLGVPLKK